MSISPQRARELIAQCHHEFRMLRMSRRPAKAILSILKTVHPARQSLIFRLGAQQPTIFSPSSLPIQRDDLDHLLTYRPLQPCDPPLAVFLSQALRRLEKGDHVYTFVRDGLLVGQIWLQEIRQVSDQPPDGTHGDFPAGSVILDEFRAYGEDRKRESLFALATHALQDISAIEKAIAVYAAVLQGDVLARRVLEDLCFQRDSSLVNRGNRQDEA
jgi:hypothetical protein